jgi:hypothetical protein
LGVGLKTTVAALFVCALAGTAAFVLAGGAGAGTRSVEYSWTLTPLAGNTKWVRVANTDETNSIRLLSLRGEDFIIRSITAVRASGGTAPSCRVSTEATTFGVAYCDVDLPPDANLILEVATTGTGGYYDIAASDSTDPSTLVETQDAQTAPFLPTDASLTTAGTSTRRVTFTSKGNSYDQLELLPFGFTITKVLSITPAGSSCTQDGPGIACDTDLPANGSGTVTFETTGEASSPAAEILLSGEDGVGDQFVKQTEGAPAKYDLVASAQPPILSYRVGQKVSALPINFTVSNAATAALPSSATVATVKISGTSARAVFGSGISCGGGKLTVQALAPGKSKKVCSLRLTTTKRLARAPGRIVIDFAVACAAKAETNCANNRRRAVIVVKAKVGE